MMMRPSASASASDQESPIIIRKQQQQHQQHQRLSSPRKKKKKSNNNAKTIIMGLPAGYLKLLASGALCFFLFNVKLSLHTDTDTDTISNTSKSKSNSNHHGLDDLPITFLRRMRDATATAKTTSKFNKRNCPDYGCLVFPPEYRSELLEASLKALNTTSTDTETEPEFDFDFTSNSYAIMTRTSNRKDPPFNQDAAVAILPYRITTPIIATTTTTANHHFANHHQKKKNDDFFIGIFDGHGADGHLTAHHFRLDIPDRLAKRLSIDQQQQPLYNVNSKNSTWMKEQLLQTFVEADEVAPHNIRLRGGCTGSVVLRQDNLLYFANAGDSRTVLMAVNATEFKIVAAGPAPGVRELYSTRLDKANLPEEKLRIEGMGGTIHIPPHNPNLSRVIVHSAEFQDTIGLAMSRSLGDYEWTQIGVIPDPIVDVVDLNDYQTLVRDPATSLFIICASDGMWDLRMKQWIQKQFAEIFLPKGDPRKQHPLIKMNEIITVASPKEERFYRDDISAIVMEVTL